jgi:hypothetical protein
LQEINAALRGLREGKDGSHGEPGEPAEASLDAWVALCRTHEQAASGLMVAVADLLQAQGDLLALQGGQPASRRPRVLALGLLLEALLSGETFVSASLLAKVDTLRAETGDAPLPPALFRRLVSYFAARGRFADAEDTLFDWLESGDPEARAGGETFYERLLALDDGALAEGNLPRAEVEQGLRELRARRSPANPGASSSNANGPAPLD